MSSEMCAEMSRTELAQLLSTAEASRLRASGLFSCQVFMFCEGG